MSKKVLIISTSLRNLSNSDILADSFMKGAIDAGNEVEKVSLKDKQIAFCKGCLACQKTEKCVIEDDTQEIVNKMKSSDVIVWATPIYYYSVSGQLKTMIDRANPLYPSDYQFRDVYLLASAADDNENAVEGTVKTIQGWIDCFEKTSLKGVVFAGGVDAPGQAREHKAMNEAYNMGRKV